MRHFFSQANYNWRDCFTILGGIPRHVLEDTTKSSTLILKAACKNCSLDDCIKEIGLDSTITEKSKVIHSLIHVTSVSPFTELSLCYASQIALRIIVQRKVIEARCKMQDLLASCEGSPLTSVLCGYVFEPYAIELLERGALLLADNWYTETPKSSQMTQRCTFCRPKRKSLTKFYPTKLSMSFTCQKLKTTPQLMPGFLESVHFK